MTVASSRRRTRNAFRKFASRRFRCFGRLPAERVQFETDCRTSRLLWALPKGLSAVGSFSMFRRNPDRPRRLPSLALALYPLNTELVSAPSYEVCSICDFYDHWALRRLWLFPIFLYVCVYYSLLFTATTITIRIGFLRTGTMIQYLKY